MLHRYCCEDPTAIENFEKAISNLKLWDCHHRLEDKGYTRKQLKAAGLYWKRPASELILLLHSDHTRLHMRGSRNPNYGRTFTDIHRQHLRESHTGVKNQNFGQSHSAEWNRKIGDSQRGEKGYWYGVKRSKSDCNRISEGLFTRWKAHTTARVLAIKHKVANHEKLTKSDYCFRSRHKHLF